MSKVMNNAFLATLFLSFGLVAEPVLHDHHNFEEKVVIECLACEETGLITVKDKSKTTELFFQEKINLPQGLSSKKIHRGSFSRAPPLKN
ncbi:MAG: hypothetical protein VX039_02790 [Pseudomonadota bacterium]|nr:hypothetical protein [Pseudomonadota bacterium]MEC8153122.1 hypothetical protein [Pseudomonadota bacterium]